MIYALVFCLFFTIDILIAGKFQSFGLMPADGLMAAVILFSGIFILKIPALPKIKIMKTFKTLLVLHLAILFISRLWTSLRILTKIKWVFSIGFFILFSDIFKECTVLLSLLLGLLFYFKQKERYQLHFWIYSFFLAVIFRYGIVLLVKMMELGAIYRYLFRYHGFLDLPIVFSLLMCIHVIIQERYLYAYQLEESKLK